MENVKLFKYLCNVKKEGRSRGCGYALWVICGDLLFFVHHCGVRRCAYCGDGCHDAHRDGRHDGCHDAR